MTGIFDFWVTFIATLRATENLSVLTATAESTAIYNTLIDRSFRTVVSQWDSAIEEPDYEYHPTKVDPKVWRVVDVVDICLMAQQMDWCNELLASLLKAENQGDLQKKLKRFWTPLVSELYKELAKHNTFPTSPPFSGFLRLLIEAYLHGFLGKKPPQSAPGSIPVIECGCYYCREIKSFMVSSEGRYKHTFPPTQQGHLDEVLKPFAPFVTVTAKDRRELLITKRKGVVELQKWQTRQQEVQAFLAVIGTDTLSAVMGTRNADVQASLAGSRKFVLSPTTATLAPATVSSPTSEPAALEGSTSSADPVPALGRRRSSRTGTKRRRIS